VVPSQIVEEVIASAAPQWKIRAQERGVTYEITRDFRPSPVVLVPASALSEVLLNLLLNALEAMPGGGPVGIRVWADDTHVLFAVSDKGEGIEEANRQRIFDPFFTTRPAPASGLGLSICSRIMFNLGGTVGVESEVGRGSTFTVRLPLPQSVQALATGQAASTRLLPRRSRILVIDDEAQGAETLARLLRQTGHSVETAVTGNAGIERYRQGRFDCVVTDMVMPGLTGLTVARAIKDHDPTACVVLITDHAEQVDANQSAAAGVDRVMMKPVSRGQLLTMFEAGDPTVREFALETSCPRA
jgi:CheY-like chemotaxis protein/anti-sigma regulatory factor (Ser/Thr protein kinase)